MDLSKLLQALCFILVGGKQKVGDEVLIKPSFSQVSLKIRRYRYEWFRFRLNIGAGYHIADNMLISYQLSFGLSNLQPKADGVSSDFEDFKITNTTSNFSFTYFFN